MAEREEGKEEWGDGRTGREGPRADPVATPPAVAAVVVGGVVGGG